MLRSATTAAPGEAAEQRRHAQDGARAARDRARPGRQPNALGVESLLTQDRAPDEAVTAMAAPGCHVEQHAAARLNRAYPRPDRLDDARALVAEHRRQTGKPPDPPSACPTSEWQIPAHTIRTSTSPGPGVAQAHLLNRMGPAEGMEDGSSGLHGGLRHRRIEAVRPPPRPPTRKSHAGANRLLDFGVGLSDKAALRRGDRPGVGR